MKTYYRTCPACGANLDPGEICRCKQKKEPGDASPSPMPGKPTASIAAFPDDVNPPEKEET